MRSVISGPSVAGTLLRRVDLPATVLTSTAYAPRLRLAQHEHSSAFLCFVRDGGLVERHGKRSEDYDRLACIYRPAYDEHDDQFDESGALLNAFDLHPPWIDRLREAGFDGQRFTVRSALVQRLGARLEAELIAPDSMSDMIIEALATEVVVSACRRLGSGTGPRDRRWPDRARRLIEHDFASPLSLAGIAAAVGVHPVHLARRFRVAHGCTVGEYIRRVRVAFARRQLITTDMPIAEIALSAGFFDQSQLTKTFKRVTGGTPAAYRAQHR